MRNKGISKEISAGIIIYRKSRKGPQFLLLYHGDGYWNFPKGKLEKDEKDFKAALREVREETGLNYFDLKFDRNFKVYQHYFFRTKNQKVFKTVIYYLAETRKSKIVISDEHCGYGWFLFKDAQKLLIHQSLRKNLKQAYEAIIRQKINYKKK